MSHHEQAAIRKVIEAYGDRLRAADIPAILTLYTDDTVVMQPELETIIGKEQLAAAYRGAFGTSPSTSRSSSMTSSATTIWQRSGRRAPAP